MDRKERIEFLCRKKRQVLNVTYSPNDPAKLAISLPASEADIQQTFGA